MQNYHMPYDTFAHLIITYDVMILHKSLGMRSEDMHEKSRNLEHESIIYRTISYFMQLYNLILNS